MICSVLCSDWLLVADRMLIMCSHRAARLGLRFFQDRTESEYARARRPPPGDRAGLATRSGPRSTKFVTRPHTLVGLVEPADCTLKGCCSRHGLSAARGEAGPTSWLIRRSEAEVAARRDPGEGISGQRARCRTPAVVREQGRAANHRDHAGADGGRDLYREAAHRCCCVRACCCERSSEPGRG